MIHTQPIPMHPRPAVLRTIREAIEGALVQLRAWPVELAYDAGCIEVKAEAAVLALSARDTDRCRKLLKEASHIEEMRWPGKRQDPHPFGEALSVLENALGGALPTPAPAVVPSPVVAPAGELVGHIDEKGVGYPLMQLAPPKVFRAKPTTERGRKIQRTEAPAPYREGQAPPPKKKPHSRRVVKHHHGGRRQAPEMSSELTAHLAELMARFTGARVAIALGMSLPHLTKRRQEGRLFEHQQELLRAIPAKGLPEWRPASQVRQPRTYTPPLAPEEARNAFWGAILEGTPETIIAAAKQARRVGLAIELRKTLTQQLARLGVDAAPRLLRVRTLAMEALQ